MPRIISPSYWVDNISANTVMIVSFWLHLLYKLTKSKCQQKRAPKRSFLSDTFEFCIFFSESNKVMNMIITVLNEDLWFIAIDCYNRYQLLDGFTYTLFEGNSVERFLHEVTFLINKSVGHGRLPSIPTYSRTI